MNKINRIWDVFLWIVLFSFYLGAVSCEKEEMTVGSDCDCEIEYIVGSYPSLLSTNCGFIESNTGIKIGDCYE